MFPTRSRTTLALMGTLLALTATASAQDFDGAKTIQVGDTVQATFGGMEAETHEFSFFATAGTRISARLRVTNGTLIPRLHLTYPGGTRLGLGRSLRGKGTRNPSLVNYALPHSGTFVLAISARKGQGSYRLATRGKLSNRVGTIFPRATGEADFRFDAVAGATLSALVKPLPGRGTGARGRITGLFGPDGAPIAVSPVQDGPRSRISGVPLLATGQYILAFENTGKRGDLRVRCNFTNPAPARITHGLGEATSLSHGIVDRGDPTQAPRPGYIGSGSCGKCHQDLFQSWSGTVHNLAVRTWNRAGLTGETMVNDANGNGQDDFKDGLDLATVPAFAQYGALAPKLAYAEGEELPYRIIIGGVVYPVARTMGGNGQWKQRYLMRVQNQHYILPVQFNDLTREYSAYHPEHWYRSDTLQRYDQPGQISTDLSFEANCSGCHNTGETLRYDPAVDEYRTGYVDFNIGCEQCHGPGADHVAARGDTDKIFNPASLLDGTAEGVAASNAVCARCHTRGKAFEALHDSEVVSGFGFNRMDGVSQVLDAQDDFFVTTTKASDFWGYKEDPLFSLPGDTRLASKSHRQQSLDIDVGGHAPHAGYSPNCVSCHDPHSVDQKHMLVGHVEEDGLTISTRNNDNSLCLSCHATHGDFASVTPADVQAITGLGSPAAVAQAVVDHMKDDAAMPVAIGQYDPAGSGVGRCTTCHMVPTAKSGAWREDAAGFLFGDVSSHTFHPVWPRASELYGVTNSCSACHPLGANDSAQTIIEEWATPDDDGDATFHSDTPRSFQNGTANGHRDGGVQCASCHTTEGFVRIQVEGETLDQGQIDEVVKGALAHDEGITCRACHGKQSDGTFGEGENPLRFPAIDLCGRCHNNETVEFEDFRDHGEIIRHPQREMLLSTAGSEVPGSGSYGSTAHSSNGLFPKGCVSCHFDTQAQTGTHHFKPAVNSCNKCHSIVVFDRPSPHDDADWDGNGMAEGVQTEVQGLLDLLQAKLLEDAQIDWNGSYFEVGGDNTLPGATEAQKRAAFNWYSVVFDGSLGVHNAARAIQLLQRSYAEIAGGPVPGADLR